MHSILADGPAFPEAVAVRFMLIAMLTRRIPASTFHQIGAVYGRRWTTACEAQLGSRTLKAFALFAMCELGGVVDARFGGLADQDWRINDLLDTP
ncbi:hypothetical protein MMYC01_206266 [Madurella mycetomatis]|uniref:Uncharacterized protein n=1 Tax=Madurella mycetomatis TaxID=100816 RepID=A0A175VYI2_9PEZI|nr:hypothetical protein MMYC01_206266 [Madurella mycetomatis]